MNIQLKFLQKAIEDKNYISFNYEGKSYKKVKALKLENEKLLHSDNKKFEFSKIQKLTILKDKF